MMGPGFAAAAFAIFYTQVALVIVALILAAFSLGYWLG
jgi:hypothetical protein